jgi:hypothetical protein
LARRLVSKSSRPSPARAGPNLIMPVAAAAAALSLRLTSVRPVTQADRDSVVHRLGRRLFQTESDADAGSGCNLNLPNHPSLCSTVTVTMLTRMM